MKILVCISKAPDTTTKVVFKDANTAFVEENVTWILNPYDEWYALVRALELKEAQGGNVTVLNVGAADNEAIIRKAFALGADDAVRIDAEPTDAFVTASNIASYAKDKNYDLILFGKETINYNGGEVGGMVAELLDLTYVSMASKLDIAGGVATMERDITNGVEIIEAKLPLVISAQKGMAEQRIPNMRGIMAARSKTIETVAANGASALSVTKQFELPAEKSGCKYYTADQMDELVQALHAEAKVI
ncbi:MAG: electron transfer flavoprotein subunit beta/FixA family protein [Bacteroidia bacterium]|nr:electron transfer flavoprotein subunit beta/FixA family protein [Bacteroidia bacterium]